MTDVYAEHGLDSDFWTTPVGDPGTGDLFSGAVYERGAMTSRTTSPGDRPIPA